ncbi:MAG: hypothetical protein ACO3DT_16355 [Gammaproteobacteria bacterium]
MTSDPKRIALDVTESFKSLLGSEAQDAIGEHQFEALQGMVREAIAEHSDAIVERLEQDLKQIRSEMVERRPLEL